MQSGVGHDCAMPNSPPGLSSQPLTQLQPEQIRRYTFLWL
jgi:hypothetical protein